MRYVIKINNSFLLNIPILSSGKKKVVLLSNEETILQKDKTVSFQKRLELWKILARLNDPFTLRQREKLSLSDLQMI